MSDEDHTYYTAVRFQESSSGLQNVGRPAETQGPREDGHRNYCISWHLIAILLGILYFILLVAVAVLVNHIFQHRPEKNEFQKPLSNLHQEYCIMQNDSYLWEEKLRNKSMECKALKGELDSLSRTLNKYYRETKVVLDCQWPTGKDIEGHLVCYGIKCYYLIEDKKNWRECHHTCLGCNLYLLKIDDDHELKFLQFQVKSGKYWFGLSYDRYEKKWRWIDGQRPKLDLSITNVHHHTRRCAFLSKTNVEDGTCEERYSCICERRVDKFFDSPSSNRK